MMERLQKVLARAGFGSRRACETLITEGRVTVGGAVVRELGTRVDPETAVITCDGRPVRAERPVYFAVNKPIGVVCTNRDPQGRRTVLDLLPKGGERVYSVGRLDEDSEGLLIVTNDGALCNLLTHPRYGIPKTYHVVVRGELGTEAIDRVQRGVWLSEGRTGGARLLVKKRTREFSVVEVTIAEGMNREIRRVFAKVGHPVERLKRIRVGPVELGDLASGACRPLAPAEVDALRAAAGRDTGGFPPGPRRREPSPGVPEAERGVAPGESPGDRLTRGPRGSGGFRPTRGFAGRDRGPGRTAFGRPPRFTKAGRPGDSRASAFESRGRGAMDRPGGGFRRSSGAPRFGGRGARPDRGPGAGGGAKPGGGYRAAGGGRFRGGESRLGGGPRPGGGFRSPGGHGSKGGGPRSRGPGGSGGGRPRR